MGRGAKGERIRGRARRLWQQASETAFEKAGQSVGDLAWVIYTAVEIKDENPIHHTGRTENGALHTLKTSCTGEALALRALLEHTPLIPSSPPDCRVK